jgi:hypothetical protein
MEMRAFGGQVEFLFFIFLVERTHFHFHFLIPR